MNPQVVIQLKNRESIYTGSAAALKQAIIDKSDGVGDSLGPAYPVTVTAPLATTVANSYFIRLFLDQASI